MFQILLGFWEWITHYKPYNRLHPTWYVKYQ